MRIIIKETINTEIINQKKIITIINNMLEKTKVIVTIRKNNTNLDIINLRNMILMHQDNIKIEKQDLYLEIITNKEKLVEGITKGEYQYKFNFNVNISSL